MIPIDELTKRVTTLEETVNHLTTHHDEQFVEIHDEMSAIDRCERLFNLDINRRTQSATRRNILTKRRREQTKGRPRVVKVSKRQ
jgi:predicted nucleic acid-binding OB-fold protein